MKLNSFHGFNTSPIVKLVPFFQLRALYSQLTISEAEVSRLTQTLTSAEETWSNDRSHLMSGLNETTAQKVGCNYSTKISQQQFLILFKSVITAKCALKAIVLYCHLKKQIIESKIVIFKGHTQIKSKL